MAIYQMFVKLFDGDTRCLQFHTPTISGSSLEEALRSTTRIPPSAFLRIASGNCSIHEETVIDASADTNLFPSCAVLLRLRGGKGGFGSLLRGAATKAGQKKTNNFDACRDMSGRRLRHVNAEKKLEEWRAEAEERRLEKIAEEFLKKKAKNSKNKGSADAEKYVQKYREDSDKCMGEVDASVRESFQLYENSKRKILPASGPHASKRLKIWFGKGKEVESDSDGEDDEEKENSVVLDDGGCSVQSQDEEGSSGSFSAGQSEGDSSGGASVESNLVEENGIIQKERLEQETCLGNGIVTSDAIGLVEPNQVAYELGASSGSEAVDACTDVSGSEDVDACAKSSESEGVSADVDASGIRDANAETKPLTEPSAGVCDGVADQSTNIPSHEDPLNFDEFNSATEMEILGLERLKNELQARGLKCGGTLQERAARLYMLKTNPIEKLPKKLLAKPAK